MTIRGDVYTRLEQGPREPKFRAVCDWCKWEGPLRMNVWTAEHDAYDVHEHSTSHLSHDEE